MAFVSSLSVSHACGLTLSSLSQSLDPEAVAQNRKQEMISSCASRVQAILKMRTPM
jgi:hypothetical protein